MVDYSRPEAVRALGDRDAAVDELIAPIDVGEIDFKNLKPIRDAIQADMSALKQTEEQSKLESVVNVAMRDGHQNLIRVYQPPNASAKGPLIVLIHGGGFFLGENPMLVPTARAFSRLFGATVVTLTYRLAPEHRFPTSINDCWDSLVWVARNAHSLNADPSTGFIVGGTSAGGHLAATVAQMAVSDDFSPPLTGLWSSAPTLLTEEIVPEKYRHLYLSKEECRNAPWLSTSEMEQIKDFLQADLKSPLFSPVNAPKAHIGMPPTYIQVCGLDPVRDDGLIYEALLRENGVKTRLDAYKGAPHLYWFEVVTKGPARQCHVDTLEAFAWMLGRKITDADIEEALLILAKKE